MRRELSGRNASGDDEDAASRSRTPHLASSTNHLALSLLELDRVDEAAELCRRPMAQLREQPRWNAMWRVVLPRCAVSIAAKLDASTAAALLDAAATFLTAAGDEPFPDDEAKLLAEIRAQKIAVGCHTRRGE